MTKQNYRLFLALMAFVSLWVFLASYYFQYFRQLQPCPLCLMQRYSVFLLLLLSLSGQAVKQLAKARWVSWMQIFVALIGIYFAGRQLWLQSLPPDKLPACMPDLSILVRYFPLKDVLHALFWGAGDCAEVSWRFLGLSMPAWSLAYFICMLLMAIFLLWRLKK